MRASRWSVGVVLVVAALVRPAAAEPLAVKPGLWEVTADGAGGALSALQRLLAKQLGKLTPEQQAKIQQYLDAAAATGGAALERRVCVTPALLQQPLAGNGPHNCTRSVVSSSAAALEIQASCSGEHHATGTLRLTVADPQTVNGTIDVQLTTKDGTTIPVHRSLQGRWVAADCGSVKPPG